MLKPKPTPDISHLIETNQTNPSLIPIPKTSLLNNQFNGLNLPIIDTSTKTLRSFGTYYKGIPNDSIFISFDPEGICNFLGSIKVGKINTSTHIKDFDIIVGGNIYKGDQILTDELVSTQLHQELRIKLIEKLKQFPIDGYTLIFYNNGIIKQELSTEKDLNGYRVELIENFEFPLTENFQVLDSNPGDLLKSKDCLKKLAKCQTNAFEYLGDLLYEEGLVMKPLEGVWAEADKERKIIFIGNHSGMMRYGFGVKFYKGVSVTKNIKLSENKDQLYGYWVCGMYKEGNFDEWKGFFDEDSEISFGKLFRLIEEKNKKEFKGKEINFTYFKF